MHIFVFLMKSRKFILPFLVIFLSLLLVAQTGSSDSKSSSKPGLPTSFLTGEYELAYDHLLEQYNKALVSVCNNDNEKAYAIWSGILLDLSDYAKTTEMDLNGLKLWINVFFSSTGEIKHIVYYPKPNSKNMDFDKLTSFFTSFCQNYRMKEPLPDKCMLSATASFPIFVKK